MLVAVISVIVFGTGAAVALFYDPEPPDGAPVANAPEYKSGVGAGKEPVPYTPTLEEAMRRLSKRARSFNVLLLSDSTTLDTKYGWHMLTFDWLAEETGRPWQMWQWNADPAVAQVGYLGPMPWRGGKGAAITVWNAAVSGKGFDYAAEHIDEMVPPKVTVDLMIVNHGHNIEPEPTYIEGLAMVDRLHAGPLRDAAIAMVAQNPERGAVTRVHRMDLLADYALAYSLKHKLELIDVYSAFQAQEDPTALVDRETMRHPTHEGYRLWFEVARGVLEPALPGLP